jgi:hypothetical protein
MFLPLTIEAIPVTTASPFSASHMRDALRV